MRAAVDGRGRALKSATVPSGAWILMVPSWHAAVPPDDPGPGWPRGPRWRSGSSARRPVAYTGRSGVCCRLPACRAGGHIPDLREGFLWLLPVPVDRMRPKGRSSTGRAAVSKTAGCRFKSCRPCSTATTAYGRSPAVRRQRGRQQGREDVERVSNDHDGVIGGRAGARRRRPRRTRPRRTRRHAEVGGGPPGRSADGRVRPRTRATPRDETDRRRRCATTRVGPTTQSTRADDR